jgi:hypothetical protein
MTSAYKHVVVADPSRIRDTDSVTFGILNNPIHYIWSYDNFRNLPFFDVDHCTPIDSPKHQMPYYVYERLTPALRLATILLGRARSFLERVMFAPMLSPTWRDPYPHPALSEDWCAGQESSIALEVQLNDLARTYRIYYCPGEHPSQPGHSFCGATDILLPVPGRSAIIYSGIDAAALEIVSRFYFDQRPIEEQQNLFLSLAITLVHELTHALHFKRYLQCINDGVLSRLPLGSEEPAYRPHERLRELGNRLEVEVFGGEISHPIALNSTGESEWVTDGSQGLNITTYDAREDRPCEQYRLAPSTVRSFFERQTWVIANGQHRLLKLYLLPV